ncbi:TauD/TfdA family dioxygenase [Pseudomonas sp. RHF3.3-3]|uniref:Putative taurine catabolism dioxygenase n=1 Tax=Pseudomonas asplenii TaxID=53407 RepID=A0A0M9GEN7_9PSED|nr:TauD/TfdA family dioxygenase [Pseudomonas fuscovaginae]KPA89263.1 putative taurine catabolism dioxygenase [Pseudomonas fuscovaginae]
MDLSDLSCGTAKLCSSGNCRDLFKLDRSAIEDTFKSAGLLLFRGFETSPQIFESFASQFSSQTIISPGEAKLGSAVGSGMQMIARDGAEQDLHQENGAIASRPELLWFYCATPAASQGQTTYADGIAIWQALAAETRERFLAQKIKYSDCLPREAWLTADGFLDARMHVGSLRLKGSSVRFDDDDTLIREYISPAVVSPKWCQQAAFVNSLRGPYNHTVTFEDGTAIPQCVLDEIDDVHRALVQEVHWQAGDIMLIDNTRYVHGRRAFQCSARTHYTFMSLANF